MPDSFSLESVDVKVTPTERFAQFLDGRGKRLTSQRRLIVEMVFSHHDHFDVEELIDHLRCLIAARRVSRPTIYRTLGELVEAGMLRSMTLGGRSVYEH
ncbi:MAG: transcriptional repressor, partial [Patescibacteria group bacterium]|nr:transcriptional repressor [Patescibacteria group bacterium]